MRRSRFEVAVEEEQLQLARGVTYVYEQEKLYFTPPSKRRSKTFDWFITNPSGYQWVLETKGYWDTKARLAETEAIAQNPDVDIRYLFQRDLMIGPTSKTSYTAWCVARGILSAVGTIPKEWFS